MAFEFKDQPLRTFFLIYELTTVLLFRLPYWVAISAFPATRPSPLWTFRKSIMVHLIRHMFEDFSVKTGPVIANRDYRSVKAEPGVQGVWVEPAPKSIATEDLLLWCSIGQTDFIRIPGYWKAKNGFEIHPGAAPQPSEKVLYFMHGGAYIHLSAHPSSPTAQIPLNLLNHSGPNLRRSFSIEYRLSTFSPYTPSHSFPAALVDALAGYLYLINTVGFAPEDIIAAGDSAGGNLALSLTRYLVENRDKGIKGLPKPPGQLILFSPWVDISDSHDLPGMSAYTNANTDYIVRPRTGRHYAKAAFTGPFGVGAAKFNRYISPASPFAGARFTGGWPRTFINSGGGEVLRDQIRTLKERMERDLGNGGGVTYLETPDQPHDFTIFDWSEPERTEVFQTIVKWVDTA